MCNRYKLDSDYSQIVDAFAGLVAADAVPPNNNRPAQIHPGQPGLVLADGQLRQMVWGFPLALRGASGQVLKPKPVNNARTDKLHTPFWNASLRARRCLIPANGWAEAQGTKGAMTRVWIAPAGEPIFALAGLWRATAEWGDAYSMVMTDASPAMAGVHARMPVLLAREDWRCWLTGDAEEAVALCRPFPGPLNIARTNEPWAARP